MDWYIKVLQNYAVFSGRARRKEYWMFSLFNALIYLACLILALIVQQAADTAILFALPVIYILAVLIPSLAVFVRRLHDIGKSGWWYFIGLIPLIGGIVLLVFLVTDSQPGDNAYGPNPKAVDLL